MDAIETKIFLEAINRSRRWLDLQMRKGIIEKEKIFVCMVNHKPISYICLSAIEKILNNNRGLK